MWKDLDMSISSTGSHPVNEWVNTSISIGGFLGETQIGNNGYQIMQQKSGALRGYNFTFDAESTELVQSFDFVDEALTGTHLWLWTLPSKSADEQLTAFFQSNGTDLSMATRNMVRENNNLSPP